MRTDRSIRIVALVAIVTIGVVTSAAILLGGVRHASRLGADDANALVVARNLLRQGTFSVDYIAHFFLPWPSVNHPEDSFPIFQPALIAGIATLVGDVGVAGSLLNASFLLAYLVGLPVIALAWYGPVPALVLQAGLLAQEWWGYFDRPLNDQGAMVLTGFAFIALLRSFDPPSLRRLGARWRVHLPLASAVALFALAAQYKHSANFAVLGGAVAIFVLDRNRTVRDRGVRALVLLGGVALAHVPVLLWHWRTFGFPGLPHNARGRDFARAIGDRDEFWVLWEGIRTYMPAHPDAIPTLSEQVARDGALEPLLSAPLRRMALGMRRAVGHGEIARVGWLGCLVVSALRGSTQSNIAARLALIVFAAFAFLPAFSHYEMRYLFPLRPLFAISGALAARELLVDAASWTGALALRGTLAGTLIGCALLPWSASPRAVHRGAIAAFGVVALGTWVVRRRGHGAPAPLLAGAAAFWLISFGGRAASGTWRLIDASNPRENPVRDAAVMIRAATAPKDVIMARHVFQIAHYAERLTLVVPAHTEDICAAASRYGARWLALTSDERQGQQGLDDFVGRMPVRDRAAGFALYELRCPEAAATGAR